jgi:hypothetical protein
VHGPFLDTVLAWSWLPVALVMHAKAQSIDATQAFMGSIFLLSFAHQPLTLGLVYADPVQRAAHRKLYSWTPIVAAVAILIGLNISLTTVALMAGLWNAEHTLMQRYGVLRIYGRKVGDEHGRVEKAMLISWLVVALLYLAAFVDLQSLTHRLGIDGTNRRSVDILDGVSPVATVLFWAACAVAAALAWQWVQRERRVVSSVARRAKWMYMASTLGLVVAVMVDPVAGFAGYVAAHAIEYFAIVIS